MCGKTSTSLFDLPGICDLQELILHHLDTEARYEAALVCREFYLSICRLEKNRSLKLDAKIKDDKIFESMLLSSRRFQEIQVDAGYNCEEATALRIGAVLAKFKSHMKKLELSHFPLCSRAIYTPIMDAMTDVEDLSLYWTESKSTQGVFDLQKDFTKLKRLCLCSKSVASSGILNRISDDALEALLIGSYYDFLPSDDKHLQTFLNRQKMLKKLRLSTETALELSLNHLDLKELALSGASDHSLAAVLKHQPNLRILSCVSIGSASFNELLKMRKLEVLHGNFTGEMTGELANLEELKISGDSSFLQRIAFPKLTTFRVQEQNIYNEDGELMLIPESLGQENVLALTRSATNLQHMTINNNRIDFLPVIIENFAKLETLKLEPAEVDALIFQPPSRPNLSLKELIIQRQLHGHNTPDAAIYQTIALCPNLERISLGDIVFTKHEILNVIQSHPRLTHFHFGSENGNEQLFNEHSNGENSLDPTMMAIINIFRNSPNFISLHFGGIANWGEQLVEDVLAGDADQIEVYKTAWNWRQCNLSLTKKVHDPFKNFDRS